MPAPQSISSSSSSSSSSSFPSSSSASASGADNSNCQLKCQNCCYTDSLSSTNPTFRKNRGLFLSETPYPRRGGHKFANGIGRNGANFGPNDFWEEEAVPNVVVKPIVIINGRRARDVKFRQAPTAFASPKLDAAMRSTEIDPQSNTLLSESQSTQLSSSVMGGSPQSAGPSSLSSSLDQARSSPMSPSSASASASVAPAAVSSGATPITKLSSSLSQPLSSKASSSFSTDSSSLRPVPEVKNPPSVVSAVAQSPRK